MLTEVKQNIKFILLSMKYNLKSCAEYKKSFIVQTVFMMINNGFFLIFWNVVFGINEGSINGITPKEILYLWSIPTIAWGIANTIFGGIRSLNDYIITGSLDTYLLQPKNILLSVLVSKMEFGACGDLFYGLIIGIFAVNNVFQYLELLFFAILGALIMLSTFIIIRTLAIWIGNVEEIDHIYTNNLLITFCTYPFEIFGKIIKALMYTIIPAYYIVHLPIKIMESFNLKSTLIIIGVTILFMSVSTIFFYKSLERYESGNNIAMKE